MNDSASPARRRAALVYNPIKVDFAALSESLLRLSAEAGWATPLFVETTVDDPGQAATAEALDLGATHVLVAGGDGTVRAVAEALAGSRTPLTIVPSGTGNLLARNLKLPLGKPDDMIAATFAGDTSSIDIGFAEVQRATGEHERHAFVVMAGIGLDAAMIQNTNPTLKKRMGWVAYVGGAARSLTQSKPFRSTYQLAGKREHTSRVHSILFANCGQLPAGIALLPDAEINDGLLDVAVFHARGIFDWVRVGHTVWWENSVLRRFRFGRRIAQRRAHRAQHMHVMQGRWLEASVIEAQPIELDGDEFGTALRLRCVIEPGALTVVVPRGAGFVPLHATE